MSSRFYNYDLIGDIHGYASTLILLLQKLGYSQNTKEIFEHKDRKVIFLGDFIDRGNEESKVIDIVKPMVEEGYALAIMGNHEFNAICYHSKHPITKEPLREHSDKNIKGHKAFLHEFPLDDENTKSVIEWFKTLPIFIELNEFRVIHACWNEEYLNFVRPLLNDDSTLPEKLYVKASQKDSKEYDAIEVLLKGLEISLPNGSYFSDKDGNKRTEIRIKWWKSGAKTYRDYAQVPDNQLHNIPDVELANDVVDPTYSDDNKPVFVGHYWFTGKPEILKNNVACLDYSVANKEKLVCYRWNKGDTEITNKQFVYVNWKDNSSDQRDKNI